MSNFLRGGQITAHKFRMIFQVIRIMCRITLCIMAITIFLTFKNNIASYQWRIIPAILSKYTFEDLNPNKIVTYKNKWGVEVQDRAKNLARNKDVIYAEKQFIFVLMLAIKRLAWVIILSFSFAMIYFWIKGKSLRENKEIRGSFLIKEYDLKKQIKRYNNKFKGLYQYVLAGVPYVATGKGKNYTPGEQAHTLILGATGSGKTKVIQDLVCQINKRGEKAIIVDIKGDFIKHFYNKSRGDIILNPLDVRGANWSFFQETDTLKGFDTIAKTLIPYTPGDPFWANAARVVFSELASIYSDPNLSIAEFSKKVLSLKLADLEKMLKSTRANHLVNQKADKTVICIMMMLSVHLAPFKLYYKTNDIFSIQDWINSDQNNFLFIATSPDVKGSLNPLVQMQIDIAINALCSSKNSTQRQIWFILDELAYFDSGIPTLKDGLTTSRSFGGAFVLGVQDLSSLNKVYGHDLARVIANNCRTKLIMNVDDSYTAKWCSDLFGEGEVEEWQEGLSYGAHEMRDGISSSKTNQIKRTILPSQFSQLKTGAGYMKMPFFHPALIKFKEFNIDIQNDFFIENKSLKVLLEKEMKEAQKNRIKLEKEMGVPSEKITTGKELSSQIALEDKNQTFKSEPTF